jgi:alkylated DNA repair protein (DNA oxidative demethylase)
MSVQTTSFGPLGWVGNQSGYGYAKYNPFTQQAWPPIPALLSTMARDAASAAGYHHFEPDSCLINVYAIGTKMGLHQDKDERDFHQPIVSVSLGIPATFLFGGAKRSDPTMKIPVLHGDVIVWGGASRRFYHGISTIRPNQHPQLGNIRCNLTFRKAG